MRKEAGGGTSPAGTWRPWDLLRPRTLQPWDPNLLSSRGVTAALVTAPEGNRVSISFPLFKIQFLNFIFY